MPIKHSRVTRRLGLKTAIAAAVALPLTSTAPLTATAAAPDRSSRRLEVMSFNLRYASTAEPNSWAARRPVTRELLRRESLHVIGTQEASISRRATSRPTSAGTTTGSARNARAAAATSSWRRKAPGTPAASLGTTIKSPTTRASHALAPAAGRVVAGQA